MKTSETLKEFAAALAKAQASVKPAEKGRKNTYYDSTYSTLSSVWEACREALTANGFSVLQDPASAGKTVSITTRLLHASGEWAEGVLTLEARDTSPPSIGSAITYGRRYGLASMVGVSPDDDDDGAAAARPPAREPQRERPAQARPTNGHGPAQAVGGGPSDADLVGAWQTFASHVAGAAGAEWRAEMDREGVEPDKRETLANAHQITNHLCTLALDKGTLKPEAIEKPGKPGVRDPVRTRTAVARMYAGHHEAVEAKAREYLAAKRSELRLKLGIPDFDSDRDAADPEGEMAGAAIGDIEPDAGMRG